MDPTDYRASLRSVLADTSQDVRARLRAVADAVEGREMLVSILVFLGQDLEGNFDVVAEYDGPDASTLNRRMWDQRRLSTVIENVGWEPPVPQPPRGWDRVEVVETVLDVVAEWVEPLLPADASTITWEVATPDGESDLRPLLVTT